MRNAAPTDSSATQSESRSPAVRKAVILAAGVGDRLRPFTDELPKCLLPVTGIPILVNTMTHLAALGIVEVVIVIGHHKEAILSRVGPSFEGMSIRYVVSEDYATTNNIYSLWLARSHLTDDVLLLEADVFFEALPGIVWVWRKIAELCMTKSSTRRFSV